MHGLKDLMGGNCQIQAMTSRVLTRSSEAEAQKSSKKCTAVKEPYSDTPYQCEPSFTFSCRYMFGLLHATPKL